jgi:hypothetical protein
VLEGRDASNIYFHRISAVTHVLVVGEQAGLQGHGQRLRGCALPANKKRNIGADNLLRLLLFVFRVAVS